MPAQIAPKLKKSIEGHRYALSKTIELNATRPAQRLNRGLQRIRVQIITDAEQGADSGVEDFAAEFGHGIRGADGKLTIRCVAGQVLCQFQLETLETVATDGAAEADDGRFTDAGCTGYIADTHVDRCGRIGQHKVGDTAFGLAQFRTVLLNAAQEVDLIHGSREGGKKDSTGARTVLLA